MIHLHEVGGAVRDAQPDGPAPPHVVWHVVRQEDDHVLVVLDVLLLAPENTEKLSVLLRLISLGISPSLVAVLMGSMVLAGEHFVGSRAQGVQAYSTFLSQINC